MDPTQNQQNSQNIPQPAQQVVSQQTVPQQATQQQQEVSQVSVTYPVQPVTPPVDPVSIPRKESGPVATTPIGEYIKPTDSEPILHPEVVKAGVETSPNHERPSIPQDLQQAGVSHAGPTQQVNISQAPVVQLPISQQQASAIAKKKKWHESLTWLAIFILRQLKIIEADKKGI